MAGWPISLILSKSPPENPSINEIIAREKYITGYACNGNEPTGTVTYLFREVLNASTENGDEEIEAKQLYQTSHEFS